MHALSAYFDSSALVKLAVEEPESSAMRRWSQKTESRLASVVSIAEVGIAVRKLIPSQADTEIDQLFAGFGLINATRDIVEHASRMRGLRALDAIHLASALSLGADLDCLVAYDLRLLDAAERYGIKQVSPGRQTRSPSVVSPK